MVWAASTEGDGGICSLSISTAWAWSIAASSVLRPCHGRIAVSGFALEVVFDVEVGVTDIVICPIKCPWMPVKDDVQPLEKPGPGHERFADA